MGLDTSRLEAHSKSNELQVELQRRGNALEVKFANLQEVAAEAQWRFEKTRAEHRMRTITATDGCAVDGGEGVEPGSIIGAWEEARHVVGRCLGAGEEARPSRYFCLDGAVFDM